jgi:hypothetical protein
MFSPSREQRNRYIWPEAQENPWCANMPSDSIQGAKHDPSNPHMKTTCIHPDLPYGFGI